MNELELLQKLSEVANDLDYSGFEKEATLFDKILIKVAQDAINGSSGSSSPTFLDYPKGDPDNYLQGMLDQLGWTSKDVDVSDNYVLDLEFYDNNGKPINTKNPHSNQAETFSRKKGLEFLENRLGVEDKFDFHPLGEVRWRREQDGINISGRGGIKETLPLNTEEKLIHERMSHWSDDDLINNNTSKEKLLEKRREWDENARKNRGGI